MIAAPPPTAAASALLIPAALLVAACIAPQSGSGAHASPVAPAPQTAPATPATVVEEQWPDGTPHVRRHVLRQPDGTLLDDGLYESWYQNGRREYEGGYVNGQVDGCHRRWHANGRLATEEYYRKGQRHGPRWTWDEQGLLRKQEYFVDDQPDGIWRVWKSSGELRMEHRFDARSASQPTSQ